MTIYDLFLLQIMAHLLTDFTFQSKEWVVRKRENGFQSTQLYLHVLVVFLVSISFAQPKGI